MGRGGKKVVNVKVVIETGIETGIEIGIEIEIEIEIEIGITMDRGTTIEMAEETETAKGTGKATDGEEVTVRR